MDSFDNRFKSFNSKWAHKGSCSPREMALAGFYFLTEDCVICYYCKKQLEGWEDTDIPYEEHRTHSPICPFVKMFEKPPTIVTFGQALILEEQRTFLQFRTMIANHQASVEKEIKLLLAKNKTAKKKYGKRRK